MESWLFLGVIFLIALLAKNQSLLIATLAVLVLKVLPHSDKILTLLNQKGINWGVTLISATILVPIATGDIVLKDLLNTLKSPLGWVATICGILVAILSARGVGLIAQSPEVTVALVFGTIVGVVFLKGIAAGPVIAAGITYCIMQVITAITNH
ncbi:DUF441 domain-containing protein [Enterococcus sp. CSURQ0835]|uniref:DUF441 domain-containing protein n=1 Tax=Enterococcus sp. CSURQ0835 TaxID=2681394 RepID=UPI00135A8BDD|nr:DUF441 domain-containing protein [Enterococcus sp. CSURQ0835]